MLALRAIREYYRCPMLLQQPDGKKRLLNDPRWGFDPTSHIELLTKEGDFFELQEEAMDKGFVLEDRLGSGRAIRSSTGTAIWASLYCKSVFINVPIQQLTLQEDVLTVDMQGYWEEEAALFADRGIRAAFLDTLPLFYDGPVRARTRYRFRDAMEAKSLNKNTYTLFIRDLLEIVDILERNKYPWPEHSICYRCHYKDCPSRNTKPASGVEYEGTVCFDPREA